MRIGEGDREEVCDCGNGFVPVVVVWFAHGRKERGGAAVTEKGGEERRGGETHMNFIFNNRDSV